MKTLIDNTIEQVEVVSKNRFFGLRYWELYCTRKDGKFNRFTLLVTVMEDMGHAKNLGSWRKVEKWLNTEEGLAWINERKGEARCTDFGMIL